MKKPVVDYREFRFCRLNEPRFSHLKLLAGWIFYFSMYFITENLIPAERCHPIHCALDDLIPFNEFFVIFYVGWYFLIFGSLLYTLLYNVENFRRLQIYIIVTQAVAMTCYVLWPSRQDLRPDVFARDNALTQLMAFIYSFDTSTGVCPSLHVGYSFGVLSVAWKDKGVPGWGKALLLFDVIMICLAVCFVKQHSVLDVVAALPLCLLAECITFGKSYWRPRLHLRTH
ncbi:MAG: phosphatidic acid phosphatase [Oscillospiraceae bacterium]|nr:phosphatidic acid phosphatase [Oscillospiraceae bacterium]